MKSFVTVMFSDAYTLIIVFLPIFGLAAVAAFKDINKRSAGGAIAFLALPFLVGSAYALAVALADYQQAVGLLLITLQSNFPWILLWPLELMIVLICLAIWLVRRWRNLQVLLRVQTIISFLYLTVFLFVAGAARAFIWSSYLVISIVVALTYAGALLKAHQRASADVP